MQLLASNGKDILGELYAKVIGSLAEGRAGFAVHFTSIPPELTTVFARLRVETNKHGKSFTELSH